MYWPNLRQSLPRSAKGREILRQLDGSANLIEVLKRLLRIFVGAVRAGDVEVVRLLYNGGLNADAKDEHGQTVLMIAAGQGSAEIVEILLAHEWEKQTMVMTSHYGGTILGKPASVDTRDEKGRTALTIAAAAGHVDVVRLLLDAGADMNAADSRGVTPVFTACFRRRSRILRMLIAAGAGVNILSYGGAVSPLEYAATADIEIFVHWLLRAGADPNLQNARGKTALMACVKTGPAHAKIVEALIDAGADLSLADTAGRTALDHARAGGSRLICALLEDAAARG